MRVVNICSVRRALIGTSFLIKMLIIGQTRLILSFSLDVLTLFLSNIKNKMLMKIMNPNNRLIKIVVDIIFFDIELSL